MARINIEESLYRDTRWLRLVAKVGCEYKALGMITTAWTLAQRHWLAKGMVPEKVWPKDLDLLIEFELANRIEGGVYVKGSKTAFKWLEQRSAAGRSGGKKTQSVVKRSLNGRFVEDQSDVKPLYSLLSSQELNTHTSNKDQLHPLAKTWNEHCGVLSRVSRMTAKRTRLCQAVFKSNSPEQWVVLVKRVTQSDFCTGKSEGGWRATFDWFVRPDTHVKVAEGLYDQKKTKATGGWN